MEKFEFRNEKSFGDTENPSIWHYLHFPNALFFPQGGFMGIGGKEGLN